MNANNNGNSTKRNDIYIHDMPYSIFQNLCYMLDKNNLWWKLAIDHMNYDEEEIKQSINPNKVKSPSEELITMWGELNHTVTDLFVLLHQMQHYTAMECIKSLVDVKLHKLINMQPAAPKNKNPTPNKENPLRMLNIPKSQATFDNNNQQPSPNLTSQTMETIKEYANAIPNIDYDDLVKATDNWSSKILGRGGFGTVYEGVWKFTRVAIKRLEYKEAKDKEAARSMKNHVQQSLNELKFLNSCRQDNILPIYGFSMNGDEPCLVYQLMTGGSLEQRLIIKPGRRPLTCAERLKIAQGSARGLQFLHTYKEPPLIHGDIKPANILLDQNCEPKIGDFGLAREGPATLNSVMKVSSVFGTRPYLPIEFLASKKLSTKVDTFSFGILLLELITGLRAYDPHRKPEFLISYVTSEMSKNANFDHLIDKYLPNDSETLRICQFIIALGKICASEKPENRPEMTMVLSHLELQSQR